MYMKRFLPFVFSVILGGTASATDARYFNAGTVTNAIPIDATVFENWGTFSDILTFEFPYSTRNTRYFTNRGSMIGSVGFQIDTVDPTATPPRRPLTSFFNANGATIAGVDNGLRFFGVTTVSGGAFVLGASAGTASFLKVAATNLVNRGELSVGTVGLMELKGQDIDLARSSVTAGQASNDDTTNFFGNDVSRGFIVTSNQYVNAYGVEDIYWGAGPANINLQDGTFGYFPPLGVRTPEHQVQVRSSVLGFGGIFGLIQTLPTTFPASFDSFANITQAGTNISIQVVFLKTNFTDTNISAKVRYGFTSNPPGQGRNPLGRAAMVEFSTPEFDPVSGETITNSIYFLDGSGQQTNIVLLTNALSINGYSRPSGYEIATATPIEWRFAQPPNTTYDPTLLFPGNTYDEKDDNEGFYGGYAAKVGRNPETFSGASFNSAFNFGFFDDTFLLFPDPTNQPGRIDITADTLDLTLTRIRAEGLLSMNAKHLKGGGASDISAGIINADFGSTNGSMVISNIFPSHFKRVRGDLFAWSAIWANVETNDFVTNRVTFHVLVLDHDLKADFVPTIRNLSLKSTNLFISDDLTVLRSARFEAENLTISGGITVSDNAINIRSGNLVGVKDFLIESNAFFQGANDAFFGFDTAQGFNSITNRGAITATAPLFKAARFENSGTITAKEGGSTIIQAGTANLNNGIIVAGRDVHISAGEVVATNSMITAGQASANGLTQFGQLMLNVTNLLTDGGTESSNFWQVSDGFVLARKPAQGDLLGTEIRTIASGFQEAQHLWAGIDRGPGPDGFNNNVALKRLILDLRSSNSRLRFSGTGSQNAIYVETLDLELGTGVDINTPLGNLIAIDPNLRIYYINSNAGDKLSAAFPGRIVQVEDFELAKGSSTLVVRANGQGIITPNLDGKILDLGAGYKMKASAGVGSMFAGWSGSMKSLNSTLEFKMRRNMILEANFVKNPFDGVQGGYNGIYFDSLNGAAHESSGFISFKVSKKGVVTGQLISGKSYRFAGGIGASGHASIVVARPGASPLVLDLQLDIPDNPDFVSGTVTDGTWIAGFTGGRAASGSVAAGQYTLVFAGDGASGGGNGFGTATVDARGGVKFKGVLADGTKVNQKANIFGDGQWPFYSPLYKGGGSIVSLITFAEGTPVTLGGDATWTKTDGSAGFIHSPAVMGSRYTPPAKGGNAIGTSSATVVLMGGNLSEPIVNEASLDGGKIVTTGPGQVNLSIKASNGLLNGSFVHPGTSAKFAIHGVVLQEQNSARGYFLGPNQSGSVLLEAN